MKKYFLLAFAFISIHGFSQPIDIDLAKTVSINVYKSNYQNGYYIKNELKDVNTDNIIIKSSYVKKYNGHNSYYVVNFEDGGWVITSSYKSLGPILANSPTGSINETDKLPEIFTSWIKQYEAQIDFAYKNSIRINEIQVKWDSLASLNDKIKKPSSLKSFSATTTSGATGFYLLSTHWGQDVNNDRSNGLHAAYNSQLNTCNCTSSSKLSPDEFVEAGGIAVSIAQVLKYWGYATGNQANFDWWNMPDALNYYNTYPNLNADFNKQTSAIAYLIKRCYDISGSRSTFYCDATTNNNPNHLDENITLFKSWGYNNLQTNYLDWNIIKSELDNQRPVILYGGKNNLSVYDQQLALSTAIIIDGYANDGSYHFNLGGGGIGDGFYSPNFSDYALTDPDLEKKKYYTYLDNIPCPIDGRFMYNTKMLTGIKPSWQQSTTNTISSTIIGSSPLSTNETWQASSIVIGSQASTPFLVNNGNNGRLIATKSILILPGFNASNGSTFLAQIYENQTGGLKRYIETMNEPIENPSSNDQSDVLISVSPNPITNGSITVSSSKDIEGIVNIDIFNSLGQKVYNSIDNGLFSKYINFGDYTKGIYILKVTFGSNVSITKILCQ